MNLPRFALTHRSIILAFVVVFLVVGAFNFGTMSRREDPEIIIRDALIVTSWPGAPATRVEELITDPIEDVIVEIAEIETVKSKSMVGLSVVQVTAGDAVNETDQVWDDVRAKVDSIRGELPPGSAPPFVNSDFGDVYEIVFALYQTPLDAAGEYTYSPRELELLAERIEEEVELIDTVARVEFWGNRAERIYVEIDSSDWAKLGLTAAQLTDLFQARNIVFPGGELDTADARYAINPTGEFTSIEQMNELVIGRVDGRLPVQLGDLPVSIERRYQEPPRALSRITTPGLPHQAAIIIGVSMKSGRNLTQMNEAVERVLGTLRASTIPPDVTLQRVNDLPRQVNTRIVDFQFNLLQGVFIVLGVALLTMGWRPALIMATVPLGMIGVLIGLLVTGWAMGFMAMLGILALGGIVINNAIVLVDFIETNVGAGKDLMSAVAEAGRVRMRPILLTTLTTIGGLLPLSLFGGALWAPMTNGMIFGLIVSTGLTLFVIPSLYVFMVEKAGMSVPGLSSQMVGGQA